MSDPCCCLTSDFDADHQDFYHEEMRVARKEHRCRECGKTIKPRERYNRATGKTGNHIWSNATCVICDEVRKHFYCYGGWLFGALWDDVREQLFENGFRFECMKGLSIEAREALLNDWRRWKGLAR